MKRAALELEVARRIRDACLQQMIEAYEDAGIRGLCGAGRFELAVDAVRDMDLHAIVHELRAKG